MSTDKRNKYFQELSRNLRHEGLTVKTETEEGLLPVELDGQRLCLVLDTGAVRYWKEDVADDYRSAALDRVTDITKITAEYMRQMETAPQLTASGLTGDYRLLAEFNDTVLAGHPSKYGVQFITEDCARSVLEEFGFKRVNFVLANSLLEFQKSINCKHLVSDETYQWGRRVFVSPDGEYNRYYAVDTAAGLLEAFIGQTRDAYQALGLFGPEHCVGDRHEQDYTGKVLVMITDTLRESCWDPHNMLWLAEGGFGCSPTSSGRAVYATCLGDGEKTRWNRSDFVGVLDEQYLPDWATEKLEELRGPQQEQNGGPVMGGMTMN